MVPSKTKALSDEEERQKSMKRDIELGLLAIEPPPKDGAQFDIDPRMKIFEAEEDRDHLHHPPKDISRQIQRTKLRIPVQQILSEPEEDRDHLYHK